MQRGHVWRGVLILVIVAISGGLLYSMPMRLGLDLRGGVHVVLQARDEAGAPVTAEAMERARAIIDRRVNGLGIAEPTIQQEGERRIILELPGISDPQQAVEVIRKPAFLEFKDPLGNTALTGGNLVNASISRDQFGRPAVALEFDEEGAKKFEVLTARFVGQQIPIVLDGEVLSSPVVRQAITGGHAIIEGDFTTEEARQLVVQLNAGALPVALDVMEVRAVGPILGQESIDRSLRAGVIGLLLVALYMVMYYRLPGIMADLALGVYVLLVLGVLVGLKATLTLPGIAGLILSIGMAVDGNVIIFEHIKEEFRGGKRVRAAIASGFSRALGTILDSNITTLITAAALFYFGSGPVRGFAVTLSLGILASMFTAIVVTRSLLNLVVDGNPELVGRQFGARGLAAR